MIIISGTIGDHGIALMSQREGLRFPSPIESDCAPLRGLVADMVAVCPDIHSLRKPTHGGLATTLNESANQSGVGIVIEEDRVPVRQEVQAICDLLGLDPLYVANEGKLVAVVPSGDAEKVLARMKQNRYGAEATVIGRVVADHPERVAMKTRLGTSRIVGMPVGELLPRIC